LGEIIIEHRNEAMLYNSHPLSPFLNEMSKPCEIFRSKSYRKIIVINCEN